MDIVSVKDDMAYCMTCQDYYYIKDLLNNIYTRPVSQLSKLDDSIEDEEPKSDHNSGLEDDANEFLDLTDGV